MSFEFSNRMILADGEPVSATLVRACRNVEFDHLAFGEVWIAALLFEALLKLGPALYTSQFEDSPTQILHQRVPVERVLE